MDLPYLAIHVQCNQTPFVSPGKLRLDYDTAEEVLILIEEERRVSFVNLLIRFQWSNGCSLQSLQVKAENK